MVKIWCADPAGGCGQGGQVVPEFARRGWVFLAGPGQEVFGPGAAVVPEPAAPEAFGRHGGKPDKGIGPLPGGAEDRPGEPAEPGEGSSYPGGVHPAGCMAWNATPVPVNRRAHSRLSATWARLALA